jgi:hypothetical protein
VSYNPGALERKVDFVGRNSPLRRAGFTHASREESLIDMISLPGKFLQLLSGDTDVVLFEEHVAFLKLAGFFF